MIAPDAWTSGMKMGQPDRMGDSQRYPENHLPIAGQQPEPDGRFAELREEFLIGYGYNTARAYWGDLDDLYRWATQRGKDPLNLTQRDFNQYMALYRRRGYSENTIRRKMTAARGLYDLLGNEATAIATPRYLAPRTK